jgi:TRAP transporter TAXI family solute receptor
MIMNRIQALRYNPYALLAILVLVIVFVFGVLLTLIPAPPKSIAIATGFQDGLYYRFGERMQSSLKKEGVDLQVLTTGGTLDNLALLADPKSGVDLAMIQGGVADVAQYPQLVSIAGMFYEPVWVFYREASFKGMPDGLTLLTQLKGKRVSIGNPGSGTSSIAKLLLETSGMQSADLDMQSLTPQEGANKLAAGHLDAVFVVAASEAPLLNSFINLPGIQLMNFVQADAYTRALPFLTKVEIPRGMLSIESDQPRLSRQMIAATATLVSRENISPAIVSLLLQNAQGILKSYSRLQKPGEFPSVNGLDFPLQIDSEIYLKDGPSFLHRHLPFWTAVWVGRFARVVIPILAILIPLIAYIPALRDLSLRIRLSRIYAELKVIEQSVSDPASREKNRQMLAEIQTQVNAMKVSSLESKEFYDLKGHVNMVEERLKLDS